MKDTIQCECGGHYTQYGTHKYYNDKSKYTHEHTKRHLTYQTKKDNLTPWELYLQHNNPNIPTATLL